MDEHERAVREDERRRVGDLAGGVYLFVMPWLLVWAALAIVLMPMGVVLPVWAEGAISFVVAGGLVAWYVNRI